MRNALLALGFLTLAACSSSASGSSTEPDTSTVLPSQPPSPPERTTLSQPSVEAPKDGTFAEVVYVFMRDRERGRWFCTGTLVSKSIVVTAAHCLDPKMFISYEIVAPLAPNKPRVPASSPQTFGGDYENVANPDIGFLRLERPIELPIYAELTDVTERVLAGEAISAAALVRDEETPEAALHFSSNQPVSSTTQFGYDHGFGTPMFSHGGDSGAGLFLVENGKPTHKLIGVARQPEPARALDHFTRIDSSFLDWFIDAK
jgi:hypothetical protein